MAWAMSHADFKTQLFRFVDVLPACRDGADVVRHLHEYFEGVTVPRALELGLDVADSVPLGGVVSAAGARPHVSRMAREFTAGADPTAAVRWLRSGWEAGEAFTADLLGEKVVRDAEADRYADRLLDLIDTLIDATASWPDRPVLEHDPWGPLPRVDVSVKP